MKTFPPARFTGLFIAFLAIAPACLQAHSAAEEMAEAARNFLVSLTPEQRAKAAFEFKSDERLNWHFIPKPREGLSFKAMTPAQALLAHALLNSGLSHRGYAKATTIMSLEQILSELEAGRGQFNRDPQVYFVSIFGSPGAKATWGWRVEGHHLSINFTVVNGEQITATPSFMGTNPGEVRTGPRKGLRVLAAEEDLARQLVKSLDGEQRGAAIFTNVAPRDIITAAVRKVSPLDPAGVLSSKLNAEQSELLMTLIKEYLHRHRPEVAGKDLEKIEKAGLKEIRFAWAGGVEPGDGHYYRVQGPTFLLEYDNTQNDANHVHAVWRDFQNDFGEDLLRKHYDQVPHP